MTNEPSEEELDNAIRKMQELLARPDSPREMRLTAQYDQFGSQLRDMSEEEWEKAVQNMVEDTELTEDEVRNWFGRLSGKCEADDAEWTGK